MNTFPITIVEPTITPLAAGRVARLRRPTGPRASLARVQPGDLLWIREPFRFAAKWDKLAPTAAIKEGAVPHFLAGMPKGSIEMLGLGKPRFARELPRSCHRLHLLVTAVTLAHVQDTTEAEMRAEGFESRNAWVDAWDEAVTFSKDNGLTWSDNPQVLVIDFELQKRPVPAEVTT